MILDKKILSIDTDDDALNYDEFRDYLQEHTERQKQILATEFNKKGEKLLHEIEIKNRSKEQRKIKLIPYIIKHTKNKYSEEELLSYSFEDILQIHTELKTLHPPLLPKLFKFIFDL